MNLPMCTALGVHTQYWKKKSPVRTLQVIAHSVTNVIEDSLMPNKLNQKKIVQLLFCACILGCYRQQGLNESVNSTKDHVHLFSSENGNCLSSFF